MGDLSSRFVLRMPPEMHAGLKKLARLQGISLNALLLQKLSLTHAPGQSDGLTSSIDILLEALRKKFGERLVGVVLFGSAARGEMREDSDIDFLLVMDRREPIARNLYREWDVLLKGAFAGQHLFSRVSPQFVHLPDISDGISSIWLECAIEGVVLLDRKRLISSALREIRGEISRGRYLRKMSHGHPYWVRENAANDEPSRSIKGDSHAE